MVAQMSEKNQVLESCVSYVDSVLDHALLTPYDSSGRSILSNGALETYEMAKEPAFRTALVNCIVNHAERATNTFYKVNLPSNFKGVNLRTKFYEDGLRNFLNKSQINELAICYAKQLTMKNEEVQTKSR